MTQEPLVPAYFDVPRTLRSDRFRLEPLGPQHNTADVADLDPVLRQHVRHWLSDVWPFDEVSHAG